MFCMPFCVCVCVEGGQLWRDPCLPVFFGRQWFAPCPVQLLFSTSFLESVELCLFLRPFSLNVARHVLAIFRLNRSGSIMSECGQWNWSQLSVHNWLVLKLSGQLSFHIGPGKYFFTALYMYSRSVLEQDTKLNFKWSN